MGRQGEAAVRISDMNQRARALRRCFGGCLGRCLGQYLVIAGIALGLLGRCDFSFAASPNPLAGEILGQVKNATGIGQMGATVYLYNRYDEMVRKGLTNENGRF